MDRRTHHQISIGAGTALACLAMIWHNSADANGGQAVFPSLGWWLGQTLRGPGFLVEIYGGLTVLTATAALVLNALFYVLLVETALQSIDVFRTGDVPPWWVWAIPAVVIGLNTYEAETVWICDASNDLMSKPPVGIGFNLFVAFPAILLFLPFLDYAPELGQMVVLDLAAMCLYGAVAHLTVRSGRLRWMATFVAIVLGTIGTCFVVLYCLR